jgi:hypothetical protein
MRHLQDEQLLLLIDGELKSRAAGQARSHLETCWQCRVELQEIQDTVGECVRYRKNILHSHLPPPPAPWNDIYRQFNEIDASMEPAFFQRFTHLLQWPVQSVARWAPVVVALLVLAVILYQYRQTPSVHAAELLRKAIAADTHTGRPRAIQIRTRDRSFNRRSASTADAVALSSLQARFVAAKFDWEDPLSAKSYQNWRDGLATKQDQVFEESNAYRIRTETSAGELMSATLTLSNKDLKPIQERLEFRDSEWVEITELPDETPTAAAPSRAAGSFKEPAPPVAAIADADAGDELHAIAALHSVGADLGDPVQVSLSGGKVLVTGAGIAPGRERQIQDILGANPKVVVRFTDSPLAKTTPQRVPTDNSTSAEIQQFWI